MARYMTQLQSLTVTQAMDILTTPDTQKLSTGNEQPCIGDVHLLQVSSLTELLKRLENSQFKWANGGRHALPKKNPLVVKTYYRSTKDNMCRFFFTAGNFVLDKQHYVLVQYVAERSTTSFATNVASSSTCTSKVTASKFANTNIINAPHVKTVPIEQHSGNCLLLCKIGPTPYCNICYCHMCADLQLNLHLFCPFFNFYYFKPVEILG